MAQMMSGPASSDDVGLSTPVSLEELQKIRDLVNDTCNPSEEDLPAKVSV